MLHRQINPHADPTTSSSNELDDMDVDGTIAEKQIQGKETSSLTTMTTTRAVPPSSSRPTQVRQATARAAHARAAPFTSQSVTRSPRQCTTPALSDHCIPTFQDTLQPKPHEIVPVKLAQVATFRTIASVLTLSDIRASGAANSELFDALKLPTSIGQTATLSSRTAPSSSEVPASALVNTSAQLAQSSSSSSSSASGSSSAGSSLNRFSWDEDSKCLCIVPPNASTATAAATVRVLPQTVRDGSLTAVKMQEILAAIGTTAFPAGVDWTETWSKYTKSSKKDVLSVCLNQRLTSILTLLNKT